MYLAVSLLFDFFFLNINDLCMIITIFLMNTNENEFMVEKPIPIVFALVFFFSL